VFDLPECLLPVPAISEWGLIVTSLLALTAGTIVQTRRQSTPQTPASS
jgi:hypothetical protein